MGIVTQVEDVQWMFSNKLYDHNIIHTHLYYSYCYYFLAVTSVVVFLLLLLFIIFFYILKYLKIADAQSLLIRVDQAYLSVKSSDKLKISA